MIRALFVFGLLGIGSSAFGFQFTPQISDCPSGTLVGRHYEGACQTEHFYVEWRTMPRADWQAHLRNIDSSKPVAFALYVPDRGRDGACVFDREVPAAAIRSSSLYKNAFSEVQRAPTIWWDMPGHVIKFWDGGDHPSVRCYATGSTGYPYFEITFFPFGARLFNDEISLLVRAMMLEFDWR